MGAFHYDDAEKIVTFAKERLSSGESGNLLLDLTSLADFSFSAISDQLMHISSMFQFVYSLDRIAIISDEDWLRSAARLESALLPGVTYQVYDDDEVEAARAWVLEETDSPHAGAIREIDIGNPAVVAYEISGRITRDEAERVVDVVKQRLAQPDCSRLMIVIRNWHGFDADTMLSQRLMGAKLEMIDDLERYAVVGGPDWIRGMANALNPLVKPDVKGFDLEDEDKAVDWLVN